MAELMDVTEQYIKKAGLKKRKALGQYFTCSTVRSKLMELLPKIKSPRILEPSCGTGEFIKSIYEYFDDPTIDAFDIDQSVVKIAKNSFPKANINTYDSLNIDFEEKYDFVIGNPPYFEFSPKEDIKNKYADILNGRPNIYSLFVKLGLEMLKPGGYLAYVIPPSMNNGAYFSKLREYIVSKANIEKIVLLDSDLFDSAQQKVMILILKKGKNLGGYIFKKNDTSIFSIKADYLNEQFHNKKSLKELGFEVKTGEVVWNQNKNILTDNPKHTLLIWAHNISNDGLTLNNKAKHQYIRCQGQNKKAIVVNRITGSGNDAKIRAVLIDGKKEWISENHTNVIYATEKATISLEDVYNQIISEKTLNIIKNITGNTQISKNELENLIPINP